MNKKLLVACSLALVTALLLTTAAFAYPTGPFGKESEDAPPPKDAARKAEQLKEQTSADTPYSGPIPAGGIWYLLNGSFDDDWDGNTPLQWTVEQGDASSFGQGPWRNRSSDAYFFFEITLIENRPRNAYLFQEIELNPGQYWVEARSTMYGTDPDAGGYMTYYALVPSHMAMKNGVFDPEGIDSGDWKELWDNAKVCDWALEGWSKTDAELNTCDWLKRAETVTVEGGAYLFILRASLGLSSHKAQGLYIFDDVQIIDADEAKASQNGCENTFCRGEITSLIEK